MRLPALILLTCAGLAAQPAAFEGVATHSVTKQPMEGVHVRLIGFSFDGPGDAYGAMSDRSGHFSIASVKPGTYILMPEYRGFVYARKKQGVVPFPTVTIKAGEPVSDFKLEMTPHAVIVGRVVDEYGDPSQRVMVQAEAASPDAAMASVDLSEAAPGNSNTDDRGKFRMVLPPGKYYVKAVLQGGGGSAGRGALPEIRTDGTSPAEYGATWYPSASAKDQGAVVEVQAGAEASIEIRLARASLQRKLTMSGVVRGIPEGGTNIFVQMQPVGNQGRITSSQGTGVSTDGQFTFSRLEPGTYRLTATAMNSPNQMQSPPLEIKLDSDLTNLELHLAGSGELTGTLEFAGAKAGAGASPEKRTVRLEASGSFGFGQSPSGEVNKDGTFHIAGVSGGRFTLHIDPLPENAYIGKLVLDGTVVPGDVLELPHGSRNSKLKVTVSPNGAQISGGLLDKDGNKLTSPVAIVLLVDDPEKLDLNDNLENMARVGADGQYSFHGIRPGKYRLLAIDLFHSPDIQKPETVKKLGAAAEEFEIKEGDRIAKDIKVVGQEDANAKPKQ